MVAFLIHLRACKLVGLGAVFPGPGNNGVQFPHQGLQVPAANAVAASNAAIRKIPEKIRTVFLIMPSPVL